LGRVERVRVEWGRVEPGQVEWGRAQWPREFPEWVARADLCLVDFRGVPREPVVPVAPVPVALDRVEWGRAGCVPVAWDRAAWDRAACVPVEWGQVVLGQVALGRVVARV
jgi:hypothetical protein